MDTFIQYRFVEVEDGKIIRVDDVEITGRSMSWDDYIRILGCQNWEYAGTLPATTSESLSGFTMLFMRTMLRLDE